jgi:hypothetical protein
MTMLAEPPAVTSERISIREYFSQQQELYTKTDAKTIGPELERLAAEGKSKPREIVDAARPAASPLHPYFTWDDQLAAEGFRQLQAGRMTRTIMVYTASAGQERREPAFRPITVKVVASRPAAPGMVPSPVPAPGQAPAGTEAPARRGRPAIAPSPAATVARPDAEATVEGADEHLIGEALQALSGWASAHRAHRRRPSFGSIFEPVFLAIAEARGRAGGTICPSRLGLGAAPQRTAGHGKEGGWAG